MAEKTKAPAKSEQGENKPKAAPAKSEQGEALEFGNCDSAKKYSLKHLKVPANHYVVRHFGTVALASGQTMEDPTTNRFQVYDVQTFNKLREQPIKKDIQQKSQFEELGLNVDILHDPTK
jgi:hypothetical protein